MARSKEGNDANDVVAEFVVVVGLAIVISAVFAHIFVVNHEFRASLVQEPLHEVDAKATEAVLVGNDNLADSSRVDGVQKLDKVGALEVKPAPNVGEVFVLGIVLAEEGTLPIEVGTLMGAADAGVANATLRGRFVALCVDTKDVLNVGELVEALPIATGA